MQRTTLLARAAAGFFLLQFALVTAQSGAPTQTPLVPHAVPAPPALLAPFQVAAGTVQELAAPLAPMSDFAVEVVLGNATVTLALSPHELRRQGYQLLVDDGTAIAPQPSGPLVTFQGSIVGVPDSGVAMQVQNGQLKGIVRNGDDLWGIQPARESDPQAGAQQHVVYRAADNWNVPYVCGLGAGTPVPGGSPIGTDVAWRTDLAIEVDFPQYSRFGNATTAQNDALSVINAMDVIYRRDCQITFQVGTVLVRTAADPYSSTDPGTLLGQFQNWWNANQGGVLRDVAMLFTGRALNGSVIGIAYLGQMCNVPSAYGLCETMYNGPATNFTFRTGLQSHEMGHIWNAPHCDASPDCRIMCSGLGGCTGIVSSFSPGEQTPIVNTRNVAGCLTQVPTAPTITSVTPSTTTAFAPPQLTINGTGLTGVNQVMIGTQTFTTGISVVNDSQIRVTPPDGNALGFEILAVSNAAGTSNGLLLIYTESNPIRLVAPAVVLGGTTMNFRFGGRVADFWYVGVSLFNSTSLVQGFPVLNSFSGLAIGTLDAVGIGSYAIPVPPSILNGLIVYDQVLEFDPATLTINSTSNTVMTRIFL